MKSANQQARAIRAAAIFQRKAISQGEIAKFVGASQGQISRLLSGKLRRASRLFEEIFLYAERIESRVSEDMVRVNDDLVGALKETRDGCAEHAKAFAAATRSLSSLRLLG